MYSMRNYILNKFIKLDSKLLMQLIILFLDIFAFVYSLVTLNYTIITNCQRFLIYGFFFCLFFDCFLWGEKEFLYLQIFKIYVCFVSNEFEFEQFVSLFYWTISFYCYEYIWNLSNKMKIKFLILNISVIIFLLYIFSKKNLLDAIIILIFNSVFLSFLLFERLLRPIEYYSDFPKNLKQLFLQDLFSIPIMLFSWIWPYLFVFSYVSTNSLFYNIISLLLLLFIMFWENLNSFQQYYLFVFPYYTYAMIKIGVIFILLFTRRF